MQYKWTFTVIGHGTFPLDMLRYDACYPIDSESVSGLEYDRDNRHEPRKVQLRSHLNSPTNARWASFGWLVLRETVRKEKV